MTQTHCLDLTSVCGSNRGGGVRRARTVEQRWRWWRSARAAEETGGVESARRGLREFCDET
jgi:hypothetical protein